MPLKRVRRHVYFVAGRRRTRGYYNEYVWEADYPLRLQASQPERSSNIVLEFRLSEIETDEFQSKVGSKLNGTLPIAIAYRRNGEVRVRAESTWLGSRAITCVPEVACAIGWRNCLDAAAGGLCEVFDGACGSLAQTRFDFGVCVLDGVHVGRVGRQEAAFGAHRGKRFDNAGDFVGRHVVHENDVALAERRREHARDVGEKSRAIQGTVDHIWCRDAIDAERRDQRQRFPMSVWNLGDETVTDRRAAVLPDHLRRHRRLVDEDETLSLELGLLGLQCGTRGRDVRPILLGCVQSFF